MLKNKKRLMGFILAILFVALCLLILWEHYQEAEQVRTFTALTRMVEKQRMIDREIDGCDAFECDVPAKPGLDFETPAERSSYLALPQPSLMVASTFPLSAGSSQRTNTYDSAFLVKQDAPEHRTVLPQYAALHAQNPDFFGWIRIEGSKVNYPVMFSPQEPERYLHRDFYGEYAKYGVPFVDGVTDVEHSRNLLIHGHNARSGILFGDLDRFLSKSFFEKHRYIHFDTLYEERVYEIIAVCRVRIPREGDNTFRYYEYANIYSALDAMEYTQFALREATFVDRMDQPMNSDYITLSTCSKHVTNGRLILVGVRRIVQVE